MTLCSKQGSVIDQYSWKSGPTTFSKSPKINFETICPGV